MRRKLSMLLGLLLVCALTVGLAKGIGVTAASKVKLNATKKTMYLGETFQLELSEAKGTVKWSTSSKKKATVANGLVTALKTGKVTIKAKDSSSGKTYKCKITIKKNAISNKKLSLKAGESYGLTLKGNTSAEWKSSNEKVARVNNGTVTALKKGTATITAKVGSNKYTCKVTVSGDDTSLTEPVELTMWCLSSGEGDMPEAYRTLPIGMKYLVAESSKEYQVMMAASVMAILPVLILFVIFEKQLVKSVTLTGMKA